MAGRSCLARTILEETCVQMTGVSEGRGTGKVLLPQDWERLWEVSGCSRAPSPLISFWLFWCNPGPRETPWVMDQLN